ncbi:hypothetical protein ETD83_28250 [Actinomadura soli]|uniref:TrbL/VirB6 plasmid conjugal transfer protein n=1 Tax=Actinomadura soli TaxID=2508997 RepID=A0A5C4J5E3_9ACTN|nr:hypothetical protein [Actinomadura soli]TMQ92020.1 hypothetical protein ETD83_28250 [Actinomadura soli]
MLLAGSSVMALASYTTAEARPDTVPASAFSTVSHAAAPSDPADPEDDGTSNDDQGSGDAEGDEEDCSWVDLPCRTTQAITGWFQALARSALKPTLDFLADTQLATPEIGSTPMKQAELVWGTSRTIANTCFVLMVMIAGVMLMSGQTLFGASTPGPAVIRLIAAFIAMNTSLILIDYAIQFANGLARSIFMGGADQIDPDEAGRLFAEGVQASIVTQGHFFAILMLVVVVLACILVFVYVMRLAIIMVLIGIAPIALMFHALTVTDGLARLWWRGFTGALAIQVCQSFVFITALRLLLSQRGDDRPSFAIPTDQTELVDLMLVIALLYILTCIPRWVARTVWQPAQPRMLGQIVRSFIVYKGVGAALGVASKAMRGGKGAHAATAAAGHGRPWPGGGGPRWHGGSHGGPSGGPSGGPAPRPDRGPGHGPRCDGRRGPDRRRRPRPGSPNGTRSGPHGAGHGGPQPGAAPRTTPHSPHGPPVPGRTGAGSPARPHPRIPTQPPTSPYRRAESPRRPASRSFVRLDPPRSRRHGRRSR